MVLKTSFDPKIIWLLPQGSVPYKQNDAPAGTEHSILAQEARQLYHFVQGGNNTLQQIFYGLLDLTFYDAYDVNAVLTTTEIVAKLQNEITLYPYFEGTHMQASFDHLLDYSASYYGYLWSEVYAEEMYSVFKEHGILNPIIGKRYREIILEKGGSEDPMVLIEKFIGRKPNYEAFYRSLGIYE